MACQQCADLPLVAASVMTEFFRPECGARFRLGGVAAPGVLMPETAMNEHNRGVFRQNDVGFAGEIVAVDAEAESGPM